MTPPPWPLLSNRNSSGRLSILPSQSMVTISSSVQAGLAIHEKPMQAMAPDRMSATMAG